MHMMHVPKFPTVYLVTMLTPWRRFFTIALDQGACKRANVDAEEEENDENDLCYIFAILILVLYTAFRDYYLLSSLCLTYCSHALCVLPESWEMLLLQEVDSAALAEYWEFDASF